MNACPFCTLPPERILLPGTHGLIIRDGYAIAVAGGGQGLVKPNQYESIDHS